jgi:uncharacterized iron-regulated protein
MLSAGLVAGILSAALIAACSGDAQSTRGDMPTEGSTNVRLIDPSDANSFDAMIDRVSGQRVILVGESHDRYDHHLNQLAVIRGLHERGVPVAIGMEFFQRPFQGHLDDYVAGEIDEETMLRRTEWYDRWRYDFRLYRDILDYARENRIPLVALNPSSETVAAVSAGGFDALPAGERERLPIAPSALDDTLEQRLRPIFAAHGHGDDSRLGRFVAVQTLWDAHMAATARDYIADKPDTRLVLLAGSGHVVYPDAIPGRLAALGIEDSAVLATGPAERYAGATPDYLFAERDVSLGSARRVGLSRPTGAADET